MLHELFGCHHRAKSLHSLQDARAPLQRLIPGLSKTRLPAGNQGGFQAQASQGRQAASAEDEPDAEEEPVMPPHRQGVRQHQQSRLLAGTSLSVMLA